MPPSTPSLSFSSFTVVSAKDGGWYVYDNNDFVFRTNNTLLNNIPSPTIVFTGSLDNCLTYIRTRALRQ